MPSRNRVKLYIPNSYYHVYNRGLNKQKVFIDTQDYVVFLNLLKRYLSKESPSDKKGRKYDSLCGQLELLAFCLMPNHFHMLVYQQELDSMTRLLRRVGTAYTFYFNKKYKRSGHLFQERFKASLISQDEYLQHISRYIHLNPKEYKTWKFSSLGNYLGTEDVEWIKPGRILELFSDREEYESFLNDYEGHKQALDEIKYEIADG